MDLLRLALISDIQTAIKQLRLFNPVGLDRIQIFVIKGCSEMFVPVPIFFNLY
jgi:hypothetical protein